MKLFNYFLLSHLLLGVAIGQVRDKDSHAVLPMDITMSSCKPKINLDLSMNGYYQLLLKEGHDLTGLLNDRRIGRRHFRDIYLATKFYPSWIKIGKRNSEYKMQYSVLNQHRAVARNKGKLIQINPDRWNKFHSSMRIGIIFHELAHSLGGMLGEIDDSQLWENIDGGWRRESSKPNGGIYRGRPRKRSAYVSDYAMTNPAEDFAESVSSYRIKPKALMATSMEKYNFIKKHIFLGQEFIDETDCNKDASDIVDFHKYEDILVDKFISRPRYFKSTYDYFLRRKKHIGRSYKDLEIYFLRTSALHYMGRIGRRGKLTSEDFIKRHSLRVYLNHVEDISVLKTDYAKELISKLRK